MELKPCPFCGGQAKYVTNIIKDGHDCYGVGYVECQACLSQTGLFNIDGYWGVQPYTEEEISKRWNRRYKETE